VPPANTVGIEFAPIATDDGDRRMLGEPDGDGGGRAVRQEVDDPMGRQIDEDGAIPMASPPRPLVHSDELQGRGMGDHGCAHESQQGSRTRRQPQAGREPGACIPSQGDANGPQGRDQSTGAPSRHGDQRGQALREDVSGACGRAAHECAHRQPDAHRKAPPGEVCQVALIPAMHPGRGHGTQRTARARGGRRELDLERLRLHGHGIKMHGARGWEQRLEQLGSCIRVHSS
jgi:hypothetical protein